MFDFTQKILSSLEEGLFVVFSKTFISVDNKIFIDTRKITHDRNWSQTSKKQFNAQNTGILGLILFFIIINKILPEIFEPEEIMETNSQLGQTQKITVDICLYADYINILFSFISTDTVVNILEYSMYKIDNYLTLLFFLLFAGNYENKNLLFLLLKH